MLKWSIKSKRHLLSDEIIMSPQYQNSGFHGDDGNIEEVTPYRYRTSDRLWTALLLWTEMSILKDGKMSPLPQEVIVASSMTKFQKRIQKRNQFKILELFKLQEWIELIEKFR